ncbi:hypothetical protein [Pseudonocardia spinosispora]|uniref:hypothetical protein n=1 Tax=Pseudonocardia spinosispora TaxID=103441 RepID=UPI0004140A46|nr:hypothetical protein [Pseudonocardia spinosispora]
MSGVELFLGGVAALAASWLVVKAKISAHRARTAAEIAQVGTSPVSLLGRVIVTALVIVGVQWFVITHPGNKTLLLVVLAFPALVTAFTLVKALTITQVRPSRSRGGRR